MVRGSSPARRLRSLVLSVAAAATIGASVAAVEAVLVPTPAQAAYPGNQITTPAVMNRASWWIGYYGVIYSQNQSNAKSDNTGESYRPDCSGFVSMAWHLNKLSGGWDLSTANFYNRTGTFSDGTAVSSVINEVAISSMQQGDAIVRHDNNTGLGHIRLFDTWANANHTQYYAYEEYTSSAEGRRALFDTPTSGWKAVRYSKRVSEPSAGETQWCTYQITGGSWTKRSGPSTSYTGEGTYSSGTQMLAADATKNGFRQMGSGAWVSASGTIRVLGGCIPV